MPRRRPLSARRDRLAVETLEPRLTPSFAITRAMTGEPLRQFTQTRADMYTPEATVPPSRINAAPDFNLRAFQPLRINLDTLTSFLADAPQEGQAGPAKVFAVPRPDGTFDRFNVWEVSIMEPGLAAQYPDIHTYRGQGIDDPTATLTADVTQFGFHAQVLGPNGSWYVDPYYHLDSSVYAAFSPSDLVRGMAPVETEPPAGSGPTAADRAAATAAARANAAPPAAHRTANGVVKRTYRTAVAATGEYTQAVGGGTVSGAQAQIVTAVNRVDGIYETELAIRMVLVANNSTLIYTNGNTDPYSNYDGGAMLDENQAIVDTRIGPANYDLGHVFSTGGGGVAFLGVVGLDGWKAGGVTGLPNPTGDDFYVDFVAHEMGHQFGGDHTFNGVTSGDDQSGGNRHGATAYEPGSGSTIMAYAGVMDTDDLQAHSDPYFHAGSLEEISDFLEDSGYGAGNVVTNTNNNIPTADAGPDYTIPARTPFALTGAGTDADATDALTYTWEQYNLGPMQALGDADNGFSPLFRSFTGTASPTRAFPRTSLVLGGGTSSAELLPTVGQTMTFRLTVRDNKAVGAYAMDDTQVTVVDTGAAFAVTNFNAATTVAGGSTQTVTWAVAGTDAAPINAAQVKILLSTDGGTTFPTVLLASTPNDGSAAVVLPNTATTRARIKVQPVNNVFYDINNANFTIAAVPKPTGVTSPAANGTYEIGATVPVRVQFNGAVNVSGTPRIALNSGGTADYVSGSGTTALTFNYLVAAGQTAADLDEASAAALTLNGGTIKAASNGLDVELTLPDPGAAGSLGASKDIVIDTSDTGHVAGVGSTAADGTYGTGAVVPVTVTFDRPVAVTGLPQLALNSDPSAVAVYTSGSGTNTLTFNYTVGPTDSSADLDYLATTSLTLNGGTVVSPITGTAADLALPAPGAAGSLGATKNIKIGLPSLTLSAASYTATEGATTFSITVRRIGDPTGAATVPYTVTAGTADGTDYTVTSAPDALSWADGVGGVKTIDLVIPDDGLSEGRERFTVTLGIPTGVTTTGLAEAVVTVRPSNPTPLRKFTEADGDLLTVSLTPKTGAGTLAVYLTNGALPISLLETSGTGSTKGTVAVAVKKAKTSADLGTTEVGGVTGTGVKTLNLAKARLTGDGIDLSGMVQTLKLNAIAAGVDVTIGGTPVPKKTTAVAVKNGIGDGADVTLTAPVRSFTAGSVGDGRITAPRIGAMTIKGDFHADLSVDGEGVVTGKPALGTLKVVGTVDGSAIDVTGIVGTVTVGSFLNSHLFAGFAGTDQGVGTFTTAPVGAVTAFRTTSKTGDFLNSSVIAATIKTVTLARVSAVNPDAYGIYADTGIGKVTVKDPNRVFVGPSTLDGFGNFQVGLV